MKWMVNPQTGHKGLVPEYPPEFSKMPDDPDRPFDRWTYSYFGALSATSNYDELMRWYERDMRLFNERLDPCKSFYLNP